MACVAGKQEARLTARQQWARSWSAMSCIINCPVRVIFINKIALTRAGTTLGTAKKTQVFCLHALPFE